MNLDLLRLVKDHFNEPVLIGFSVARVVGYMEDDEDCYMIVIYPRINQGRTSYISMVGGYIWLDNLHKQGITFPTNPEYDGEVWTDFSRLDNLLELNGSPKQTEFKVVDNQTKML